MQIDVQQLTVDLKKCLVFWKYMQRVESSASTDLCKSKFDSRLCTPIHTGHRDWFGCPGVTAATDLCKSKFDTVQKPKKGRRASASVMRGRLQGFIHIQTYPN